MSYLSVDYFQFVKNYDSNAEIRAAVNRFDWYFIPVLNPDGYEYTWTDVSYTRTKDYY